MINLFTENIKFEYSNKQILNKWIINTIKEEGYEIGNINIILTNDDYLYQLNKKYLNHDYYTDIITFQYNSGRIISGDLFISIDRIKENSKTYHESFDNELNRVIIHGILHLLGYNDKTEFERKKMREKENYYLSKLKNYEK